MSPLLSQFPRCTSLYLTMFIDYLSQPNLKDLDLTSLNAGYKGGSPCPIVLYNRLVSDLGMKNLAVSFGSTELSPVITMSYLDQEPLEVSAQGEKVSAH